MIATAIADFTLTTALGWGRERQQFGDQGGLTPCDYPGASHIDTWIGRVTGVEDVVLPDSLGAFHCRNHQLAYRSLQEDGFLDTVHAAIRHVGAERVGVIVGTSTSGIAQTEMAYQTLNQALEPDAQTLPGWYDYAHTHNIGSLAEFVAQVTGARGYRLAISTACSSSNKVFASAARAIGHGLCDAVVVGGVDTLCLTTLCGFTSLQLTSSAPCKPCDQARDGISIGEGAGFALLTRVAEPSFTAHANGTAMGYVHGYGESSDAHHMSSPHPEGKGALLAMQQALAMAGITAEDVDYINLHGQ